jgi:hypothetical protein
MQNKLILTFPRKHTSKLLELYEQVIWAEKIFSGQFSGFPRDARDDLWCFIHRIVPETRSGNWSLDISNNKKILLINVE